MEKLTRKFELEKFRAQLEVLSTPQSESMHKQEIVAYEMDVIEQAHVEEQRQIHRFSLRERLRQNRAAKDEWEARGQELWQENMKVRMARESAEARFNEVVFKKQKEKDRQTRSLATSEVLQGTKDFETGLISLGLSRKLEALSHLYRAVAHERTVASKRYCFAQNRRISAAPAVRPVGSEDIPQILKLSFAGAGRQSLAPPHALAKAVSCSSGFGFGCLGKKRCVARESNASQSAGDMSLVIWSLTQCCVVVASDEPARTAAWARLCQAYNGVNMQGQVR
ncbi:unnamed protein product [Symbiodinium sp. KB8]|nr:unnamed protein product [Symbiodinium sp. KB8]